MAILNVNRVEIPSMTRESVQELNDKYVGSAITRSLAESIDYDIEYRWRLLEYGCYSDEEVSEIKNEIRYLTELAMSLYGARV